MSKLAINGGPRLAEGLPARIWPIITAEDEKAVLEAVRLNQIGGIGDGNHPNNVFEKEFCVYHDSAYGIAVANGTVSLELSLRAGGVQPGDEVLVPAITFVASATAIVSVGAVPVFVDVDAQTCQICPIAMEKAITLRTKAVIAVHYGAYMADLDAVLAVAARHNLLVVEDCAHAQGAAWRNKGAGSWGHFGSFSFQHSKTLVAGEGGFITTNDNELFERVSLMRNIGRRTGQRSYSHFISASNCRMGGLQGAFLLSQFRRFPAQAEQRHGNLVWLEEQLRDVPGFRPLPQDTRITRRGCYFMVFDFIPELFGCSRASFIAAMKAEGVEAIFTGYNRPLYKEPAFAEANLRPLLHAGVALPAYNDLYLPNAENWAARQVTINHSYLLGDNTGARLIRDAVWKIKENAAELAVA